jgi:hypothetical protein
MASLRKKYQQHVESDHRDDDEPVAASPRPSAAAPPPAVEHPEPPALEERPPEEVAAKNAIQERLREMTEAEARAREPVEQPRAAEPQQPASQTAEEQFEQAISRFPPRIQQWCRKDPRLLHDPERIAQAQYSHHRAARECGAEGTDAYYDRMEALLGLTPRANGTPPPQSVAPPRAPTPRPAPQFTGQPPPAPPTRQNFSMTTGKSQSDSMRPTELDRHYAQVAGIPVEEYMEGKRRMLEEKKAGLHQ